MKMRSTRRRWTVRKEPGQICSKRMKTFMAIRWPFLLPILILLPLITPAQQLSRDQIIQALEKDGCVTLAERKVKICKYDYLWHGQRVEGITIRPLAEGKYPGLLLLPGRSSATTFI